MPYEFVFGIEAFSDCVFRELITEGKTDAFLYETLRVRLGRKDMLNAKPQLTRRGPSLSL